MKSGKRHLRNGPEPARQESAATGIFDLSNMIIMIKGFPFQWQYSTLPKEKKQEKYFGKRQKKRSRGKKGGETPRPQEGRLQTRDGTTWRAFRIHITLSNEHSPVQPDNAACKSPATKTASSAGASGPPPTGGSSVSETYVSSFRCTSLRDRQSPLTRSTIICSMLFQKNLLFFRFFLKSAKNQCTLPL